MSEYKNHENLIYLEPDCTLDIVFELFKAENDKTPGITEQPSKTWCLQQVKEAFPHLRLQAVKKDTCNDCEVMKLGEQYDDLKVHKATAKVMLDQQKLDFQDENCVTFDLMQVQPLPYLTFITEKCGCITF